MVSGPHKRWLDCATDDELNEYWRTEARIAETDFVRIHSRPSSDPETRLSDALRDLPLPYAFREASIALRALIRGKRKVALNHEKELEQLYGIAAMWSFNIPYSARLREQGNNVMTQIPGKVLASIPYTFDELGYEKLELVKKTDSSWFVEAWGLPRCHSTLNDLYPELWKSYEDKVIVQRNEEREKIMKDHGVNCLLYPGPPYD